MTKAVEDDECETIQVSQTKSETDVRRNDGLAEATERVKNEFEVSDDDVRRIAGGFVGQMSTFSPILLVKSLTKYQTKDCASQVKRLNNCHRLSPSCPRVAKW